MKGQVKPAAVAIGRNEGSRLERCLQSLRDDCDPIVYVDSGSTDGSIDMAKGLGVDVVELDPGERFTAAKARNLGWRRILELDSVASLIQFIDGDCELDREWIQSARSFLDVHPETAAVCGRRRERHPEASPYNRLIDMEWDSPLGESGACGGDAMMQVAALQEVGGFDPNVVAGEEPELCHRLRGAGWKIHRIDEEMTLHDAAILRGTQWYRRQLRGGYGAYQVWRMTGDDPSLPFAQMSRSAVRWTVGWLGVTVCLTVVGGLVASATGAVIAGCLGILLWLAQLMRIAYAGRQQGLDIPTAILHGWLTMTSKWPQLIGLMRCRRDFRSGQVGHIIEYKGAEDTAWRSSTPDRLTEH